MRVTGRVGCKTLHTVGRVRGAYAITFVVNTDIGEGYVSPRSGGKAGIQFNLNVRYIKAFRAFLEKVLEEALRKK